MTVEETPRRVVALAVSEYHGLALFSDGTVRGMGSNTCGQLDVGSWRDIVAVETSAWHSVGLCRDGSVVVAGSFGWKPGDVDNDGHVVGWHDIVAVATGQWHVVGLHRDGTVVAVGYNNVAGQLDVGAWTDIVELGAGLGFTAGLRRDGTVLVTGGTLFGGCDVSGWTDIVKIAVGFQHVAALRSDGHVLVANCVSVTTWHSEGDPVWHCEHEWENAVSIRAGNTSVLAILADGAVAIDVFGRGITSFVGDVLPAAIDHVYPWDSEPEIPADCLFWFADDYVANVLGVLADGRVFYGNYIWDIGEEWFELDVCALDNIWDDELTPLSKGERIRLDDLDVVIGELVLQDGVDPWWRTRFTFRNCDEGYPRYHGYKTPGRSEHIVLTHEGGCWHARDYWYAGPFTNFCDETGDTEQEALDALSIARAVHPRHYAPHMGAYANWG